MLLPWEGRVWCPPVLLLSSAGHSSWVYSHLKLHPVFSVPGAMQMLKTPMALILSVMYTRAGVHMCECPCLEMQTRFLNVTGVFLVFSTRPAEAPSGGRRQQHGHSPPVAGTRGPQWPFSYVPAGQAGVVAASPEVCNDEGGPFHRKRLLQMSRHQSPCQHRPHR